MNETGCGTVCEIEFLESLSMTALRNYAANFAQRKRWGSIDKAAIVRWLHSRGVPTAVISGAAA